MYMSFFVNRTYSLQQKFPNLKLLAPNNISTNTVYKFKMIYQLRLNKKNPETIEVSGDCSDALLMNH